MQIGLGLDITRGGGGGGGGSFFTNATLDMIFYASQYKGATPSSLTVTRASTGYAKTSTGSWTSFASGVPRITDLGLLVEEARTNIFLNSSVPVTQTITLGLGNYTIWCEGGGQVAIAAGTAVISGAGNAVPYTPLVINCTTIGTVTATVTGTLTHVQVEAGAFPTSKIDTTGASATRAADVITLTGTAFSSWYTGGTSGTIYAEGTSADTGNANTNCLFSLSDGTTNNRIQVRKAAASAFPAPTSVVVVTGGVTQTSTSVASSFWASKNQVAYAYASADGGLSPNSATATAAAAATVPTVNRAEIGSGQGVAALNGYLRRIAYLPSRQSNANIAALGPKTYFFSATGADANDGLSQAAPKQTLAAAAALGLTVGTGDSLMFKAGDTFSNATGIVVRTSGISIGSYGSGAKPVITISTDHYGIYFEDCNLGTVTNLSFARSGAASTFKGSGVIMSPNTRSMSSFLISGVDVTGFWWGISQYAEGNGIGVLTSTIENCTATSNLQSGIAYRGRYIDDFTSLGRYNTNLVIRNCTTTSNGKHGIEVAGTLTGLIDFCSASANGAIYDGGVGIFTYDSAFITIQRCESFNNVNVTGVDGAGFDIENAYDCIVQNCYAHGNEGAGFLIYNYDNGGTNGQARNTVRYCISQNDGIDAGYTGLYISGGNAGGPLSDIRVYNNVFYQSQTGRACVFIGNPAVSISIVAANNAFVASGSAVTLSGTSTNATFNTNIWRGGTSYGTGAVTTDPLFVSPGTGGTIGIWSPSALTMYRSSSGSPLSGGGVDIAGTYGWTIGTTDFYGNTIGAAPYNIGADDVQFALIAPTKVTDPTITGSYVVGDTANLSAAGTYSGSTPTLSYQWQLETGTATGVYADISGATSTTSPVWAAGDIGKRYRLGETATNGAGSSGPNYTAVGGPVAASYTFVNSEASTYVAAMSVQPSNTRKGQIDALVGALKTAGVWTTLDTFYIFASHDSQAAQLNAKNPGTNTASPVNAPTFTVDRGYAGNGTTSYINTTWQPSTGTNYTQNSAAYSLWCRTNTQSNNAGNGSTNGTSRVSITMRTTVNALTGFNNENTSTTFLATTSTDSTGFFTSNRTGASATDMYRNGVKQGSTGAVASAGRSSQAVYMGSFNNSGAAASFSSREFAVFASGSSRTSAQETDFFNAINTYLVAVGAA